MQPENLWIISLRSPSDIFVFSPDDFWATVCKTVLPILSDRCLSVCLSCPVLSVTLVYCGRAVEWIKMKLGVQVGLALGHIVSDGHPASLPKRGTAPNIRPIFVVATWLDGSTCHLVGGSPRPKRHCVRWGPSSPQTGAQPPPQFSAHVYCEQTAICIRIPLGMKVGLSLRVIVLDGTQLPPVKGHNPQFSANVRCGQTAGWTKMPLGMEVNLGPGDFVFDGDPALPQKKGTAPTQFLAHVCCGHGRPSQLLMSSCFIKAKLLGWVGFQKSDPRLTLIGARVSLL